MKKLLIAAATAVLALGVVAVIGVTSAGATLPTITANGTINCTTLGGKIAFSPPLETTGDSNSETASVAVPLKGCSFTSTNLPAGSIVTGKVTSSIATVTSDNSANSCGGLATSRATTQSVKWTDKNSAGTQLAHIVGTTASFSGFDVLFSPANEPGFDLPQDTGGTVSATGSFTGTDGGATSEANIFAKKTIAQITALCNNETTDGMVKLPVGAPGSATDPSHSLTS
jgi:hypothetical protein